MELNTLEHYIMLCAVATMDIMFYKKMNITLFGISKIKNGENKSSKFVGELV